MPGHQDDTPSRPAHQEPPVWKTPEGPEGLAAVLVGGGAWQGYSQQPGAAGVEDAGGTGGPGCGAGGRRGLARLLTATRRRRCEGRRRDRRAPEGHAAVPVGGGGAWPGFETTRRAKLAARTARGRAAAHRRTKQPGPTSTRGARNTSGATTRHHTNAPRHTKNRHPDRMSACGGARGIRTPDLLIANETRYQLRHSPKDSNSLAP